MDVIKLSICIPTLNRCSYIGETLNNIIQQLEPGVEIVIVDGGSTDGTEALINDLLQGCKAIRYYKSSSIQSEPSNKGFDQDCDLAVKLAQGTYCWLMTDDDLLAEGAVRRIVEEIDQDYGLIIVNTEIRTLRLDRVLKPKQLDIPSDLKYSHGDWQNFAATAANHLTFVGAVIIKRSIWMNRQREPYYGSGFVHVGVIFQSEILGKLLIIAKPLILLRYGNARWTKRAFCIWMFDWPKLIWSFSSLCEQSKKKACAMREPWRNPVRLLYFRALGRYSVEEYDAFLKDKYSSKLGSLMAYLVARLPVRLVYMLALVCAKIRSRRYPIHLYDLLNAHVI